MSITDIAPQATALIGQRLREVRTAKGLTQVEVSQETGIRQGRISSLERGAVTSPLTLYKLAQFYGTTTDYLIGGDGDSQQSAA